MKQTAVRLSCALMLSLLVLSSQGCATPSPTSAAGCPQIPPRPSVSQPIPDSNYSKAARSNIERWQKSLTDMPVM